MRLHDTVLRMRELLKEGHVELTPSHADAEEVYEGPGENARQAWRAFCAVALEPAFDPVDPGEGELEPVAHAGLHFAATFSEAWPGRHGEPDVPEHFELLFSRQFSIGDWGDMMNLELVIVVPAADELRTLEDTIWGAGQWTPDIATEVQAWVNQVEASPAFAVPMTRHQATRFHFCVQEIG